MKASPSPLTHSRASFPPNIPINSASVHGASKPPKGFIACGCDMKRQGLPYQSVQSMLMCSLSCLDELATTLTRSNNYSLLYVRPTSTVLALISLWTLRQRLTQKNFRRFETGERLSLMERLTALQERHAISVLVHRNAWREFTGITSHTHDIISLEWRPNTRVTRLRLRQNIYLKRHYFKHVWTRMRLLDGSTLTGTSTKKTPLKSPISHTIRLMPAPFVGCTVMSSQRFEKLLRKVW